MEADAPESSPQGEASGVKAEPTEGSPQGEETEIKDEHMGATEEVNDENMATEDSSPDEEHMPPDISPDKDDGLHDQGIWGRVETVVDPEAFKAATSAEEKNEEAFENMANAKDNKGLEHTEEFKYFFEVIFSGEEERKPHAYADPAEGRILHKWSLPLWCAGRSCQCLQGSTYGLACKSGSTSND